MQTKELIYYKTKCKKCSTENIVACISKHENYFGIFEFNKEELELARIAGLNTKWLISKNGKWYLANVCRVCNEKIIEQKYERFCCAPYPPASDMTAEEYYSSLELNTTERKKIGYYCEACD